MIEGFDVEGVIMSKLRVLCIFFFFGRGGGGLKSKSIVSREIDSGGFFFSKYRVKNHVKLRGI